MNCRVPIASFLYSMNLRIYFSECVSFSSMKNENIIFRRRIQFLCLILYFLDDFGVAATSFCLLLPQCFFLFLRRPFLLSSR